MSESRKFYTREQAAERVGKHLSTIYRWEERGQLVFLLDRCSESALLEAEKRSRGSVGRPSKAARLAALDEARAAVLAVPTSWASDANMLKRAAAAIDKLKAAA